MSSSHSDDEHALRLDATSSTIANLMAEIFDDSGYLPSEIMDVMKSAGKSSRYDMHKTISDIIDIIKHPNQEFIMMWIAKCKIDNRGRLTLPKSFMEANKLDKYTDVFIQTM